MTNAKIFAVANQKGGVGKTTTTINLAFYLGEKGKKVLIIDLDPQGNSTSGIGFSRADLKKSIYDVLVNAISFREVVMQTSHEHVDITPTSLDLAAAEVEMVNLPNREYLLKDRIAEISGFYDLIFIDCPPSLGLLTINGLCAADRLIIPVQCEYYALEGLGQLVQTVNMVRDNLNPSLAVEGAILTMYDGRTNLAKEVVAEVRHFFGQRLFDTIIPRNVRLAEAPGFGKAILEYDPHSLGGRAYSALADEFLARTEKDRLHFSS